MIKIMENGKDLMAPKFNFSKENFKVYVKESSAYIGGYELIININISTEKYKEMQKIHKSDYPVLKQMELYLVTVYLLDLSLFSNPQKSVGRSSKGVNFVDVSFHFMDSYLAYGLGLDLTQWRGTNQVAQGTLIQDRISLAKKLITDAEELSLELRCECAKEANMKNVDKNELWNEKYKDQWLFKLKELELEGVSYSKLKKP